jgi:4-amino-4-deoxy-L-arabinose transferase-like glycosyltransferase
MNERLANPWLRSGALALLCLLLWLPGLFTLPPFDRDEARFAQASKQMVESGDYLDIRFQDQPRYKKPIGIYWLQSASVKLTGAISEIWSYRIPSLLSAILVVLLTAGMAARHINPRAGWLAGGLLATCLLMGVEARMGKTDATLLATIMAAHLVLLRLYLERSLSTRMTLLFWAALGIGILIKGPLILLAVLGPVVFLSVLHMSAVWLRPIKPLWGLPLLLVIVLPWLVAITIKSDGAFWQESVGKDLMAKAVSVQESKGAPPGFYLATFFITFWPWAPLMLAGGVYAWRKRAVPLVQYLLAWALPFWWLFEMFPTKLLHYTLPTFPAIAVLLALWLSDPETGAGKVLRLSMLGLSGFLILAIAALVPFAALLIDAPSPAPSFLSMASGLLLVACALVAYRMHLQRPMLAGLVALAGLLNFYAVTYSHTFLRLDAFWLSRSAAQLVQQHQTPDCAELASVGYTEPSLVFLLGTHIKLADTLENLAAPENCQMLLLAEKQLRIPYDAPRALGQITGFNYSKGDPVTLYLFKRELVR